jgi:hypothetical protein
MTLTKRPGKAVANRRSEKESADQDLPSSVADAHTVTPNPGVENRHARHRYGHATLNPRGPPLNRSTAACDHRLLSPERTGSEVGGRGRMKRFTLCRTLW